MKLKKIFKSLGIIIGLFLLFVSISLIQTLSVKEEKPVEAGNFVDVRDTRLRDLVEREVNIAKNEKNITGTCKVWSEYYNKTLKEKYPELDVRWIRHVDTCNFYGNKDCNTTHTFIVVAGYHAECIVDQSSYVCIELKNKEKEND